MSKDHHIAAVGKKTKRSRNSDPLIVILYCLVATVRAKRAVEPAVADAEDIMT
ncbi:hypothetical protein KQ944_18500 [Bacillus subtilis]|uniref:hypothetical protein n=1 Tax=Pseudochrobactrum asaccharolyticum TaxID=354351 RepID=UPI001F44615A|nr:hypothetical protein [Pseudochrobactrum asaccharolyticum]MCF7647355.1 hypothetical protein [Pseudochrobactrum asaccharolyticum]MCF7673629.1 hypothetical protein [Bacillus subtilis]